MADAAALLLFGTPEAAEATGLAPRGRIVAAATAAVNPVLMLTAGQSAVVQAIARAGLRPADIEVFEFAEAFAALCVKFRRELDAGPDRMNPNGGTMAMGAHSGRPGQSWWVAAWRNSNAATAATGSPRSAGGRARGCCHRGAVEFLTNQPCSAPRLPSSPPGGGW